MNDDLLLDENHSSNQLALTSNARNYLITISKWGKFLAILGYISTGFLIIGGISIFAMPTIESIPGFGNGMMRYLGLIYIVLAAIYGFLSYLLYSFCSKSKESVESSNSIVLEEALNNLKKLFVIVGASTIAFFVIYIIFIVVFVGGLASTSL